MIPGITRLWQYQRKTINFFEYPCNEHGLYSYEKRNMRNNSSSNIEIVMINTVKENVKNTPMIK